MCIQMQNLTYGFVENYVIEKAVTTQNYDAITFYRWVMQITTNTYVSFVFASECTLPFGLCPIEGGSCLSFRSFIFSGHVTYQIWP